MSNLSFDDFQAACLRTANNDSDHHPHLNWALGIAGEAGEYAELIKKKFFHGKDYDLADVKKELGDILYYVAVAAADHGLGFEDVATANVEKLRKRYPSGFENGGGIRE